MESRFNCDTNHFHLFILQAGIVINKIINMYCVVSVSSGRNLRTGPTHWIEDQVSFYFSESPSWWKPS